MTDQRNHCWQNGPETEDGCSTSCMLWDGHEGNHEWTRDDEITIAFADGKTVKADDAKSSYQNADLGEKEQSR